MKKILALLVLPVFLVGCGAQDTAYVDEQTPANVTTRNMPCEDEICVTEVDGVKCIVWDGTSAGGISCDWGQPVTMTPDDSTYTSDDDTHMQYPTGTPTP